MFGAGANNGIISQYSSCEIFVGNHFLFHQASTWAVSAYFFSVVHCEHGIKWYTIPQRFSVGGGHIRASGGGRELERLDGVGEGKFKV